MLPNFYRIFGHFEQHTIIIKIPCKSHKIIVLPCADIKCTCFFFGGGLVLKLLFTLPLNDYFTMDCDVNNQNCKIKTNKLFRNFVLQNQQICSEQLFLEVHYECYNENMQNKDIIPVNEMESDLALELKCPVQKNKEIYQSKCISLYINPNDLEKINSINNTTVLPICSII